MPASPVASRRPVFPPLRRALALGLALAVAGLSACSGDDAAEAEVAPAPAPAAAPASAAPATPAAAPAPEKAEAPSGAATLIGKTVPPYPDGLAEVGGSCVPVPGSVRLCDFGLQMVGSPAADGGAAMARYLIATSNTTPDAEKPSWKVIDAVDAPTLEPGTDMQLGGCRLDGKDDGGLVVAIRHGAKEGDTVIRWARHFDPAAGKLAEVDVARVACADPAAGV